MCELTPNDIIEHLPGGVAVLNPALVIHWCNDRLRTLAQCATSPIGQGFYETFGASEIVGPDLCPFHTALGRAEPARSTMRLDESRFYDVHVTPLTDANNDVSSLVVLVGDVSSQVLQQQKLHAIHQAGLELGDLLPREILEMSVEDRIELLKAKISHFTRDLLEYETVEIRLIERETLELSPLLAIGMKPDAAERTLFARPDGNGVTGFVAATGKSYLCEDTTSDPLYLSGAPDACSSLTVPLVLHEEILGTFNVESARPRAFSEHDLQFLELFSKELAVALNTLELLVAEKATTASESSARILREVSAPVDEIVNDAAWVLERYIGHEPNVCDRLNRILKQTRDIKQLIHEVGEAIAPRRSHLPPPARQQRPRLRDKRILFVDEDEAIRRAAHELLERFGCDVETAHNGEAACLMLRQFHYDTVVADIRLNDMSGYECFCRLREVNDEVPIILMTGFGYDPSHAIVQARQTGSLQSVLYKPFRLDQLLTELEGAVDTVDGSTSTD